MLAVNLISAIIGVSIGISLFIYYYFLYKMKQIKKLIIPEWARIKSKIVLKKDEFVKMKNLIEKEDVIVNKKIKKLFKKK